MYTQHLHGAEHFINASVWVPAILLAIMPFILVFVLWTIVWKGLALWHAARRGEYWWFMILLVVNTLGILEIIYLFFVAKIGFNNLFSKDSHGHSEHSHDHHEHNH
ncbi:MAG TPA: DUF5652 family protein [Candidatus Paceibacterota bacterium]|nr:DUF5652 family protein [Candidatus Paceibacterota bacterium]